MKTLNIQRYTTFWKVPKLEKFKFYKLENFLSVTDFQTKEKVPYAYFENESSYRFPLIPEEKLLSFFNKEFIDPVISTMPPFPYRRMRTEIQMKNQPKDDIQKEAIDKIISGFTTKRLNRVVVSLATGRGKTYVATNVISQLNVRAIIFVKNVLLRDQWYSSFLTHSTCKDICVVTKTDMLFDLMETDDLPDVTILTHRSMGEFIKRTSMRDVGKLFIKLGIGMKVYDEFDLENASMFKLDCNTAIKYNMYLSATDFKSGKGENKIFLSIFSDALNVGKEYNFVVPRLAKFVMYHSHPTRREIGLCNTYTMEGPVFNYKKYHEYVVNKAAYIEPLQDVWDNIISKRFYDKDNHLKTVFFIGRINTAEKFREHLKSISGLSSKDIAILNSETPKKDRDKEMSKKLIISTTDSMGRGLDLKGLDTVVDFETRNSVSVTKQVVGRVSRSGMKNVGTYIQFVDKGFPVPLRNYLTKLRDGVFNEEFTDTEELKY